MNEGGVGTRRIGGKVGFKEDCWGIRRTWRDGIRLHVQEKKRKRSVLMGED